MEQMEFLNLEPFLFNGHDGDYPVQGYCSVVTTESMIVDSIYPHPNISIMVKEIDENKQFGNNRYTRNVAIHELIKLDRIMHGVKHFYHRYKAVLRKYKETEDNEFGLLYAERYTQIKYVSFQKDSDYLTRMFQRLESSYVRLLQEAIPEVPITANPDMVVAPYLLEQILTALDIKYKR